MSVGKIVLTKSTAGTVQSLCLERTADCKYFVLKVETGHKSIFEKDSSVESSQFLYYDKTGFHITIAGREYIMIVSTKIVKSALANRPARGSIYAACSAPINACCMH